MPGSSAPACPVLLPVTSMVGAAVALQAAGIKVAGESADVVIRAEQADPEAEVESPGSC